MPIFKDSMLIFIALAQILAFTRLELDSEIRNEAVKLFYQIENSICDESCELNWTLQAFQRFVFAWWQLPATARLLFRPELESQC